MDHILMITLMSDPPPSPTKNISEAENYYHKIVCHSSWWSSGWHPWWTSWWSRVNQNHINTVVLYEAIILFIFLNFMINPDQPSSTNFTSIQRINFVENSLEHYKQTLSFKFSKGILPAKVTTFITIVTHERSLMIRQMNWLVKLQILQY